MRPSRWWYVVAAAIGVLGVVAGAFLAGNGYGKISDRVDDFQRVDVGTRGEVRLEAGDYTIYLESPGADDGAAPRPDVAVLPLEGEPLDLDVYTSTVTYSNGGRDGVALYSFDVARDGTYVVDASRVPGEALGSQIAVGPGIGAGVVLDMLLGVAVAAVAVLAAAVLALVTVLRRQSKRRFPPAPYVPA